MTQKQPLETPGENDVRILEDRPAGSEVGLSWKVFFGRSSTPMHSKKEETALRAAQQHARGYQVAVWHIIKDGPDIPELLYDHRRADEKKGGKPSASASTARAKSRRARNNTA